VGKGWKNSRIGVLGDVEAAIAPENAGGQLDTGWKSTGNLFFFVRINKPGGYRNGKRGRADPPRNARCNATRKVVFFGMQVCTMPEGTKKRVGPQNGAPRQSQGESPATLAKSSTRSPIRGKALQGASQGPP